MTDAHCHVSCGDKSVRELLAGRDFLGVHPWASIGETPLAAPPAEIVACLRRQLAASPKAAVGEIGLDRLKTRNIPPLMREIFAAQLALAFELRRPVVLHGAKCWGQVVAEVRRLKGAEPVRLLFHGFSRSDGLIPEIVALGGFISVGPAVLNDHAVNYRALVKKIPSERLLVETDNEPGGNVRIQDVLVRTAALRGVSAGELEASTDRNTDMFMGA